MTAISGPLLANKVVMITGAGRGIGAEAARLFAKHGASVMLVARTESELNKIGDEIAAAGGEAAIFAADLSQADSVEAAVKATVERYGRLDGAFNNAGVGVTVSPLHEEKEEDFDLIQSVNYKGVWLCMKAQIKAMLETSGSGSIVNASSVGSLKGNPGLGAYGASKRAVNSLTQTAAVEYGPSGIRVNAIAPGTTMTDMIQQWVAINPDIIEQISAKTPLRRPAEPIEIANAAAWLLSDYSSFVTGVVLPVDGGLSV
ncbi:SDR family NAD(P)-dependent oxidoreductase [Saccharibacillus sp. CPCC 101409]|uniref:SDR family NAD(P)-dependent oxidoreductase n=1 Tax=Saccharibacillus sp. CPCC 101409 TaxID=3058041 RepID=UPI0026740C09|nr:SDR family NAD(P)-dependent oxidoreductase [Saccharibacillus sp. CPCC 101409]MDO3410426.1 SDR family NAD(P)-dependent oxidoreductase [Saccharibacillus sp. CPCC 101409]